MITQNELHDLGYVLILIRNDIHNQNNLIVLDLLLQVVSDPSKLIENNQIRKILRPISQLNEKWEFVKHDNYYVRTLIYKEKDAIEEISAGLIELKLLLQSEKYEQAYDLADALHVLPMIIADNNGRIPTKYRKTFSHPYRKKWKVKKKWQCRLFRTRRND